MKKSNTRVYKKNVTLKEGDSDEGIFVVLVVLVGWLVGCLFVCLFVCFCVTERRRTYLQACITSSKQLQG